MNQVLRHSVMLDMFSRIEIGILIAGNSAPMGQKKKSHTAHYMEGNGPRICASNAEKLCCLVFTPYFVRLS